MSSESNNQVSWRGRLHALIVNRRFGRRRPRRVFIVRHGQSIGNVDRTIYRTVPDWKVELTDIGRAQARDAGAQITACIGDAAETVGIYLSPYYRTRQTNAGIRAVMPNKVVFQKEDPRLREQEWGGAFATDPRSWHEIETERNKYGTFFYRFATGGESGADVYDRMSLFLDTLYRDFENADVPDNLIIVTHGFAKRVLIMRWLHLSVEEFHNLSNPRNGEITELVLDESTNHYRLAKPMRTRKPAVAEVI